MAKPGCRGKTAVSTIVSVETCSELSGECGSILWEGGGMGFVYSSENISYSQFSRNGSRYSSIERQSLMHTHHNL